MPPGVLVLNAGSSSLKFALYRASAEPECVLSGTVDRIGTGESELKLKQPGQTDPRRKSVDANDHASCFAVIWDAITSLASNVPIAMAAHRIVHGGPRFFDPQRITPELLAELRQLSPFDEQHLPAEIALIEAVGARFGDLPQIACFDTGFHLDLPRVARVLPIPRRFEKAGVRRYGFHGLSYEFLLHELRRLGDPAVNCGRIILAHLGSGASMAAVRDGKCIDTTMGFTPSGGLVMGTRSGDLDPGLVEYLAITENMDSRQFGRLINRDSGLLGISGTSSDMRELLAREADDERAREAVAIFCYQAKKQIGGYIAALGGLDTLVFAGGIGENCPPVRERVCTGLEFAGVTLDRARNAETADLISSPQSRVAVRVIRTNEEWVIARAASRLLQADKRVASHQR